MISIHAPREGSDYLFCMMERDKINFNPRSPRRERLQSEADCALLGAFQSTLPAKGATADRFTEHIHKYISIHAPREGSDFPDDFLFFVGCISIHAPRGGSDRHIRFQGCWQLISIHAPRGGSDLAASRHIVFNYKFQSTLPAGGATNLCFCFMCISIFQSTLPAGGATR